jgi:hypothetical protein
VLQIRLLSRFKRLNDEIQSPTVKGKLGKQGM